MNKKNKAKFAELELRNGEMAKKIRDLIECESVMLSDKRHLFDQVGAGLRKVAELKRQASVENKRYISGFEMQGDKIIRLERDFDDAVGQNAVGQNVNLRRDNERLRGKINVEISKKLDTLKESRVPDGARIQVKAEQRTETDKEEEDRKVTALGRLVRLLWPRAGYNACQDCRVGGVRSGQPGGSDIGEG